MQQRLIIKGMSCNHCRAAVKSALERVPGTESVEVDLAPGSARVEGSASLAALTAAVKAEGYEASPAAA